jgi:lysophospholipase L1-like esterase
MKKIKCFFLVAMLVLLTDWLIISPCALMFSAYSHDETMGWMPKQDFSRNYVQRDSAGNKYNALFSLDHNRFRVYGNPATRKTKILFVGDSFTGDPYTGNNEMYFSVVKSALHEKYNMDVEIFAAGGGGYGTLQEYLLIKKQIQIIKPDIFVLQFSDNDFYNNLLEWESQGIVRSQCFLRPYFSATTGEIYHASTPGARLYRILYKKSFFFRRIDTVLQGLQYKYYGDYFNKLTPLEKEKFERGSYAVTKKMLLMLKQDFNQNAKLFIIIDSTEDKHLEELQVNLANESGYIPLLSPTRNVSTLEGKGAVVRHADGGHLNILGNKIFGEGTASELFEHLSRQQ